MSKWPIKPLAAVCDINPRQNGSDGLSPEAPVSFVPMAAVDELNGTIRLEHTRVLAECFSGYTPFRDGDVLLAKITPCMENGKAAIARGLVGGCGFGSTEFHVLRPQSEILSEWIFAFVRQPAFREAAKASFTGTAGQQRVPVEFLKGLNVPVPPLTEQKRMIEILNEVETLRALRAHADLRTSELISALFHDMFAVAQFSRLSLGELTSIITSGVTPRGGDEVYVSEGPYFIRSQNVLMNRLDVSNAACLPIDVHTQMNRTKVADGDVLLNITGASIGRIAWVQGLDREANVSQHVCLIRPKADLLNPIYLSVFISLPSTQHFILQVQAGASRQALNHQQVRALEIPLPPIALQRTFAARVTEIRELEVAQGNSRKQLGDLFQSLLHCAFEGEL